MPENLCVIWIILLVGCSQITCVLASPWTEYRNQVESIFQTLDSLNDKLSTIHMNYAQKKISAEAVAQMDVLAPRFQEAKSKAENLTPPPQWERYHQSFLGIVRLNFESSAELRRYFESGDEERLKSSLSVIRTAVEQAQQLSTLIPQDETPPTISGVQRNPLNPVAQESVELTVNATDLQTGLSKVIANYTVNNGNWTAKNMQLTAGSDWNGTWTGSIPGQAPGSTVQYEIVAMDRGGNVARSELQGYSLWDPSGYIPIVLVAVLFVLFVVVRMRSKKGRKETGTDSPATVESSGALLCPSGKLRDQSCYSPDQYKEPSKTATNYSDHY